MSKTFKDTHGRGSNERRRITAHGVKRRPIDYRKLSRALLDLAEAQAETEARAAREDHQAKPDVSLAEPPAKEGR